MFHYLFALCFSLFIAQSCLASWQQDAQQPLLAGAGHPTIQISFPQPVVSSTIPQPSAPNVDETSLPLQEKIRWFLVHETTHLISSGGMIPLGIGYVRNDALLLAMGAIFGVAGEITRTLIDGSGNTYGIDPHPTRCKALQRGFIFAKPEYLPSLLTRVSAFALSAAVAAVSPVGPWDVIIGGLAIATVAGQSLDVWATWRMIKKAHPLPRFFTDI